VIVALAVPVIAAINPIISGTRITTAQAISDYNPGGQNNAFDVALSRIGGLPRPILLTLRGVFRKKGRLLATTLTLALAGTLFISIFNVRNSLEVVIQEATQMSNFDVQVVLRDALDRRGLERRLVDIEDVVAVEGWYNTGATFERSDRVRGQSFSLIGLPQDSIFIDPKPIQGRWLEPETAFNGNEVVVTRELLELEPEMTLGGTFTALRRDGESETWRVVGVLEGQQPAAYSYYDSVTEFADAPNTANRMLLHTTGSTDEIHQRVTRNVVAYMDERDYAISSTSLGTTFRRDLAAVINIFIFILLGMSILIAIVAALGLAGTMSLSVLERTREIGVMRSVGAGNSTIRTMYLLEGLIVGLLSFLLALPLVTPLSVGLGSFLGIIFSGRPLDFNPTLTGFPIWFVLVTVVASLASLSPAQRASQISIREALSYE
jgi:putative ABC transport system permease protein